MTHNRSTNRSTKNCLGRSTSRLLVGALLAVGLGHGRAAYAHGTDIEVSPTAIEVKATFDNGEPMTEAQVLIYSPGNLETPWERGETDAEGVYLFAPDAENPGDWEVTVRKAGHGGTTTFAVDSAGVQSVTGAGSVAAPSVQKWVSMAAIIWGFVGTALFFSRQTSSTGSVSTSAVSTGAVSTGAMSTAPTATPSASSTASEKVPVSRSPGGQH